MKIEVLQNCQYKATLSDLDHAASNFVFSKELNSEVRSLLDTKNVIIITKFTVFENIHMIQIDDFRVFFETNEEHGDPVLVNPRSYF